MNRSEIMFNKLCKIEDGVKAIDIKMYKHQQTIKALSELVEEALMIDKNMFQADTLTATEAGIRQRLNVILKEGEE